MRTLLSLDDRALDSLGSQSNDHKKNYARDDVIDRRRSAECYKSGKDHGDDILADHDCDNRMTVFTECIRN